MIVKKHLATLLLILSGYVCWSQAPYYFTGYGRALVANNKYDEGSNFVKDDTISEKKSLIGNFVFDLGVNVVPSESFKVNAILRVQNEFGGFFSTGSDLLFRQVQVQGTLARKVSYQLGDIDLGMTKYTLYNFNEASRSPFEAEAFKIRRDIVDYDNFNFGNKWRVQGAEASTTMEFSKVLEQVSFSAFGSRIKPSDFMDTPDRILYGGSMKIRQSRYFQAGGNYVAISDIAGTVQDTAIHYSGSVLTGDYRAEYTTNSLIFSLFGETGMSTFDMNKMNEAQRLKTSDGFFDIGLGLKHKYIPVTVTASYRHVGPEFYSPGAQTRRIFDEADPGLLPEGMKGSALREQTVFDRLADLNLYNRSLSTTLMLFNPMYNNVLPYGPATPNRKGISTEILYGNSDSLIYANVQGQMLNEVIGVGINQKRKFMLLNAGVTFNVNRLLGLDRLMALSAGYRYENTQGSDAAKVDLKSSVLDVGLAVETLKKLDLLGGYKYFRASGTENLAFRNDFNEITSYVQFAADNTQGVVSAGLRYRFSNYIFFAANAFILSNENKLDSDYNYTINQYFFSYIMRF